MLATDSESALDITTLRTLLAEHLIIDDDLGVELANQKADLAQDLLGMFINELPSSSAKIEEALVLRDYEALEKHVHNLHGATCYCGVPRIKLLASTLETHLKHQKDEGDVPPMVALLLEELEALNGEFSSR